jgi:lipopolysaccharide export system protein LptA
MSTARMSTSRTSLRRSLRATLPALLLAVAATAAFAAGPQGPPNAVQGFSQNRDQPINIQSVSLEVRDKDKIATFIDNVHLTQGDVTLECKRLIVYYDESMSPAGTAKKSAHATGTAKPGGGQQQIRKLEAKGGVIVTQKDQVATGDSGVYDMKTNTVVLTGNVTVTQGKNIVRGDRLFVDLTTNVSRVESANGAQKRVQAVFMPQQAKEATEGAHQESKPSAGHHSARETDARGKSTAEEHRKPRQNPHQPLRLN